ncbi:MAG: D-glycero-alpha-D-manno-heptose-1,7-bisphosphate 7-phosphatase [Fidelibacterota bacterium]
MNQLNKVVFLDRDGTLNPDPGYISTIEDYEFYPDTLSSLSTLVERGYKFVIVTNQSGIARGFIQKDALDEIHRYIETKFSSAGISLLGIYCCTHHPEEDCNCRKPATGLIEDAATQHNIDLSSAVMIGDTVADVQAGKSLGMSTCLVRTGRGRKEELILRRNRIEPDFVGDNLTACTSFILGESTVMDEEFNG